MNKQLKPIPFFASEAAECRRRNRWTFMVSINPLRLHNTTGSPVNPVAVF